MSRRFHLSGEPMKLAAQQNCEAWGYGHSGGIDVFVNTLKTGPTVTCTISKRAIEAYLRRLKRATEEPRG